MKKTIALLLAVLLVLTLAGCGGAASSTKPTDNPGTTKAQQGEQETKQNTPAETDKPVEPATTEPAPTEPPVAFEEVIAIDNDECTVKITGIEDDSIWGYTLKVFLENKSSDKTYMYSVVNGAVNGVVWDPSFAAEVAPGKKSNEEISFTDSEKEALIPEFTDIELEIRVHDSDDWMADDVAHETIHIYPLGEDKATVYTREPQSTDTVIVENDQIAMIVTGYGTDSIWGYTANVYLVNKTDTALTFSADNVSVNGFMCDPFWATEVAAGKVAFSSISWSDSSFEENGITDVEDIEMDIRIHDANDWMADNIFQETVTLNP